IYGPDGRLYVSSPNGPGSPSTALLRYDAKTGAFLDTFIPSLPDGWLEFGPDGNLYVSVRNTTGVDTIERYNGTTGAPMGTFAVLDSTGTVSGLTFGPDGNLYVATYTRGHVFRFNGSTGALIDDFTQGGANAPVALAFGPDGNLYVTDYFSAVVQRYYGSTGAYPGQYTPSPLGPGRFQAG